MSRYVVSLDVGTSSVRASIHDERGHALSGLSCGQSHAPETLTDGGVEMDADALLERALTCLEQVLECAEPEVRRNLAGVGISTFWHSILGVSAEGQAATPILMWADTRSIDEVAELRAAVDERALHARTGCLLHTSYPGPRLRWVGKNRPDWLAASARWMSPGEYFFLRLFGRTGCGVGMASGTGMYHQAAGQWDGELLSHLPIRADQLNPVVPSNEPFSGLRSPWAERLPDLAEVPWFPAAGDGACSNVGSGCTGSDRVAVMVGTSGALRVMCGARPGAVSGVEPTAPFGLWKYRWDGGRYLIGGALSNGGNLFAWLRDTLQLPDGGALDEALTSTEPDGHGLTVLPFLAGERCPGWRGDARAAIVGLSWSTQPHEILRAGLEAVAYRFALIHGLAGSVADPGHQVIASGGALLASPFWTQMLADVLGREVLASAEPEASSRGAALLALECAGVIRNLGDAPARTGHVFTPDPARHERYAEGRLRQQQLYRALIGTDWERG